MLPALIGLGTSLLGYLQGQSQEDQAKKLKPSNYVPPSIQEAVGNNRMRANSSVTPGFGRGLDRLRTQTANTIYNTEKTTTNPNTIQQAVADTDAREKEVLKDLEVNNNAYKTQSLDKLNQALSVQGQYEKDSFDAYSGAKSALTGAGMRNKYNALTTLAEGAITNPEVFKFPKVNFGDIFRKKSRGLSLSGFGNGTAGMNPTDRMDFESGVL